ncbi:MAG: tyrosine-type recombinase/integrase, partial [Youngiibacter sp.]|nr:tyrosine-type recombinase/integrase [Youngiibacter sp.]
QPLPTSMDKILKALPVPLHDSNCYVSNLYGTETLKREFRNCGYDIRPHELRHSFATNLIQRGVDFRTIAKLMGDTLKTVLNTYSHVNDKMLDKAYKMIAKF